ncbi:VENN motif pre-toxin domain-containing protein, partial [Erwinia amylovora]
GDIENKARYQVEHLSESFGTGGNTGLQFLGNAAGILMVGVNGNGHDSSTTKAAVSDGSIIIRDASARRQDVAGLSRDVEHANQTLSPIFNKEKEQQRLQEAQKISEIALQAADIAATQGKIKATRAANDKIAGASQHDRDKALAELKKQDPSKQYSEADIENQVYQNFYHQALTESGFGTGGKVQQAIQAATAAVQGLAGGNIGAAIAGGAAPYLAEVIHKMTEDKTVPGGINVEANLMAHAVVGAVVAQASGHSALAGAAGATTGEFIAQQLYPGTDRNQLTEEQKQTVSTLGTLAAGLAGGLTGGSAADTVTGAQAGKNAVENNYLSSKQIDDFAAKAKGCDARGDCKQIVKEMEDLSLAQRNDLIVTCASDAAACKEKYGDIPANSLLVHEAIDRALGEDIPWSMKNDLSVLLMQQMDESGIVTSTDFAQQLQTIYGLDSQKAEILAGAAMAAVTGGLGKAGKLPAVNPSVKIATGQAVGAFEKSLAGLPPGERVAIIKQTAPKVAAEHGMVKDNQLTKKNGGRDVYRGQDGNLYALDTQHGRFEVVSPKGKHLGEVDFSMQVRKPADTSGGHNLKVK